MMSRKQERRMLRKAVRRWFKAPGGTDSTVLRTHNGREVGMRTGPCAWLCPRAIHYIDVSV